MDTLKYFSLLYFIILFSSCNEYLNEDNSFDTILIRDWNSSNCPKKIVFEKYIKNSNFEKLIKKDSDFNITCDSLNNQIMLSPFFTYKNQINYDIKLIVDDSLEYKITDIRSKKDTVKYTFTLGRKFYINNIIYHMKINGNKSYNKDAGTNIILKGTEGQFNKG